MGHADNLDPTTINDLRERVRNEFIPMVRTLRRINEDINNGDFKLKDLFHGVHVQMTGFLNSLDDPYIMGTGFLRSRFFELMFEYLKQVNRLAKDLARVDHPFE